MRAAGERKTLREPGRAWLPLLRFRPGGVGLDAASRRADTSLTGSACATPSVRERDDARSAAGIARSTSTRGAGVACERVEQRRQVGLADDAGVPPATGHDDTAAPVSAWMAPARAAASPAVTRMTRPIVAARPALASGRAITPPDREVVAEHDRRRAEQPERRADALHESRRDPPRRERTRRAR